MYNTETKAHTDRIHLCSSQENPAFPLEKLSDLSSPAIEKRVTTYLGEYRFRLSRDDYELVFDGQLKGEHETESLASQAERSISQRRLSGETTHREEADRRGILSLDNQLETAAIGDVLVWGSPPELGHKYCGKYGYNYAGRVIRIDPLTNAKQIHMYSYRIEDSNLPRYNEALSRLIGQETEFTTPEQFIEAPVVLPGFAESDIEKVFFEVFGFSVPMNEEAIKNQTLNMIDGHVDEFISALQTSQSRRTQIEKFNKLEWYATKVWERLNAFPRNEFADHIRPFTTAEQYIGRYDGSPLARVVGSCGPTKSSTGSRGSIFTRSSSFGNKEKNWDYHKGDCVVCEKKDIDVGPCNICKTCEDKFDQEESMQVA